MPTPRQRANFQAMLRLNEAIEHLYASENALDDAYNMLLERETFAAGRLHGLSVVIDHVREQLGSALKALDTDEGSDRQGS